MAAPLGPPIGQVRAGAEADLEADCAFALARLFGLASRSGNLAGLQPVYTL